MSRCKFQIPNCVFYNLNPNETPPLHFPFVRYYIGLEEADYLIRHFEEVLELLYVRKPTRLYFIFLKSRQPLYRRLSALS